MLEAAGCELAGDVYSMSEDNVKLFGTGFAELVEYPDDNSLQGRFYVFDDYCRHSRTVMILCYTALGSNCRFP